MPSRAAGRGGKGADASVKVSALGQRGSSGAASEREKISLTRPGAAGMKAAGAGSVVTAPDAGIENTVRRRRCVGALAAAGRTRSVPAAETPRNTSAAAPSAPSVVLGAPLRPRAVSSAGGSEGRFLPK